MSETPLEKMQSIVATVGAMLGREPDATVYLPLELAKLVLREVATLRVQLGEVRVQLAASEHVRVKDNELLILQRDEARAKALEDAIEVVRVWDASGRLGLTVTSGDVIGSLRALLPKVEPTCVCAETSSRNCPAHANPEPVGRVECDVCGLAARKKET